MYTQTANRSINALVYHAMVFIKVLPRVCVFFLINIQTTHTHESS
jgi:hypothetical protein